MATTSEPRPSILARTLASNLVRAGARTDSLTMTPTRRGRNGATQTIGRLPKSASRAPASTVAASTRWGAILTLADEVALLDDLAVERGEDLERIDAVEPLELGDAHVEDAGSLRAQVDPALDGGADRQPRTRHGRRETHRGVVLVQLPGFRHEDRHRVAGLGRGEHGEVVRAEAPALGPALAGDRQVTRQDRPDEARGARFPGVTRWTCTGSRPDDQRSRARAASIARRV